MTDEMTYYAEIVTLANNLYLESTRTAIYCLEALLVMFSHTDPPTVQASHRLRDIIGPMKHGSAEVDNASTH